MNYINEINNLVANLDLNILEVKELEDLEIKAEYIEEDDSIPGYGFMRMSSKYGNMDIFEISNYIEQTLKVEACEDIKVYSVENISTTISFYNKQNDKKGKKEYLKVLKDAAIKLKQKKVKEKIKNGYVVEITTGDRFIVSNNDFYDDELIGLNQNVLSEYDMKLRNKVNSYWDIVAIFDTIKAMKDSVKPIWKRGDLDE